jgi:alkanesulfonate monooxygenase SsuD/methylene tetrahydromethanopterin reductase-like flavin-dependent oxidoreductase (luciferase family)
MTRPKFGLLLPTRELAMTANFDLAPLLEFAQQAEDIGFDSVWTGDSLMARTRLDPFVVLAATAAVTSRVTLGTAALTAALRQPVIGAGLVASLDRASAGRLVVALGSGFPMPDTELEFAAAGASYAQRVGRTDETARIWRQAWRLRRDSNNPGHRFTGRYWNIDGLDRLPPPTTPAGPPLWLAGSDAPNAVARTARWYDGWLPFLPNAKAYGQAWRRIKQLAQEAGRPARSIVPGMYATITINADRDRARAELEEYVQRYYGRPLALMSTVQAYGYGTARECAQWLAGYVRAGARHIVVRIGSMDPAPRLKEVAEAILAVS